ncbi:hypothetical protein HHI36_014093 [Cryptolaemus montrouzieri]|uniref:Major facilitator superfamily (MFS) profile domain-containing protein n=1 Tax=Cryptolaemus montrouzieri TaxID=559131 RepID=A0ABD2N1S5_9CUCU
MRYFEVASKLLTQEPNKEIPGYGLGLRHVQIILQFFLVTVFVAMNMTLPITIVAMANPINSEHMGVTVSANWTDQSLILVSVQYGYAVTQLFGSVLCGAYGCRFVMPYSMFLSALVCVVIPVVTSNFGPHGLMICLIIQGASQGFSLPVVPIYLDKWVPSSERNSIGTLMYAANALGAVIATKGAALLSSSFLGWSSPYYVLGILGFFWTYFMLQFGRNVPEGCEEISAAEREYIKREKPVKDKVPWGRVLTTPALLAIWTAHAGTFWVMWLMTAEIPTYLFKVLKFSLNTDGDIVSDAYLMSWLFSFIMSGTTGYLIRSKILTVTVTRKISQSIASYLVAICLILLGFLTDRDWVIFCLTTIFVGLTASFWGFMLNYNDITHNRGIVTEIGGFIGTLTTLIPAISKNFIVTNQSDRAQWALMFWITAAVAIVTNTVFFFYSSGDIQEWDSCSSGENGELGISSQKGESRYLMGKSVPNTRDYASKGESVNNEDSSSNETKEINASRRNS